MTNFDNLQFLEKAQVDPYSEDVYDWVDDTIKKAGLVIPGNHPSGARRIGRQLETHLYTELKNLVDKYLGSVTSKTPQFQVVNEVLDIVDAWQEAMRQSIAEGFDDLYIRGVLAGIIDSTVMPAFGIADKLSMEFIRRNPQRIGDKIVIFAEDIVARFRPIIAESYTAEGVFNVENMVGELREVVTTQRYKLERIVRTETAMVSGAGRFIGWSKDPDRYFYNYFWQATRDNRTKVISSWRSQQNPLSYDEALFLWENQMQLINDYWWDDSYNQRCTISRSPINEEKRGNRWEHDQNFKLTMPLNIFD